MTTRPINEAGLSIIKKHEGLRLKRYTCPAGYPTIGYGHRLRPDEMDWEEISKDQAEAILGQDVDEVCRQLAVVVRHTPLTDNQWSALVSFVYNLGLPALINSTLLKKIRTGDYEGAARQFGRWVYAKKRILPGLVARRAEERALFESPQRMG